MGTMNRTIADLRAELRSICEREGSDPGHVDALIASVRRDDADTVKAYARAPAWIGESEAAGIADAILRSDS